MKLNFIYISTLALLLATSSFAAAPTSSSPNQQNPQIQQGQQGQTEASTPEPVKKKIDPKLQEKLNVKVDDVTEEEYQKIVAEYKQYLRAVPNSTRQEVREYRKEVVRINKEKSALYKKLSQEAQNFLTKEREIKRKLPIRDQAAFAKEIRSSQSE